MLIRSTLIRSSDFSAIFNALKYNEFICLNLGKNEICNNSWRTLINLFTLMNASEFYIFPTDFICCIDENPRVGGLR